MTSPACRDALTRVTSVGPFVASGMVPAHPFRCPRVVAS